MINQVSDNEGSFVSEGSKFIKYNGPYRERCASGTDFGSEFDGQQNRTYGNIEIFGDELVPEEGGNAEQEGGQAIH